MKKKLNKLTEKENIDFGECGFSNNNIMSNITVNQGPNHVIQN
jgi:hypothetical protein